MKIKINKKDIWKQKIYIIEVNGKAIYKTYNINKIRSYNKTMNYLKINDYNCYAIEIKKVGGLIDRYNNIL